MKIVVIGAGMSGLVAAEILGKKGHEVRMFEKAPRENFGYDWHDDVNRHVFGKLNLPLPQKTYYFVKGCWTFVTPDEKTTVHVDLPEEKRDYSIERRALAELYVQRAEKYAQVLFDNKVDSLIIENNEVKGVVVDGKKHYADLVIDSSGALSKLRASLPESYKIAKMPDKNEVFYAYRAFHKRADGSPAPEFSNKVYLKHLGEEGISWCIQDPSGDVNILIGRIGELSKKTFDNAYKMLKRSNPIISDEVVRGGGIYAIPVRHPATRFSGAGYALIGDAAYMTIPMMGSGIENSLIAGSILGNTINQADDVSVETLWKYQVEYYKQVGYTHFGVDLLKRWLLKAKAADVDYLLCKGVIDKQNLKDGSSGEEIELSFKVILEKIKRAFPRIKLLLKLKSIIDLGKKAKRDALDIPTTYDDAAIDAWENKVKGYFG